MSQITRHQLDGYLDEALTDEEMATVEKGLRESEALRRLLRVIVTERDRGEHSIGAIWRRQRLTCPSREQLGSFVLQVLESDLQDYVEFHLKIIACPYCLANLADLQHLHKEPKAKTQARRKKFFESSAGYLHVARGK
jgi:hypothetical protein